MLKVLRFVGLLSTALALGVAFTHLLEMPNKLALDRKEYLLVQQRLYEGFGRVAGPLEVISLASAIGVALLVASWKGSRADLLANLLGAVLISAALVVWQVWVGPVNRQVDSWTTVASMPADWTQLRASWEYGHAARAVLFALALVSMLIAALADAPSQVDPSKPRKARR
jgi:hypothetical protein